MIMGLLRAINPEEMTSAFLWMTFLLIPVGIIFRRQGTNRLIESLPGIAVSLGILGTFVGIFLGLINFDVQNIDKSVPDLIEGLKTAFLTSIAGMISSLLLKIIYDTIGGREDKKIVYDDPVPVLVNLLDSAIQIENTIKHNTDIMNKFFKSDEEFSLVSQIKLIRQEIIDSRKEIKTSLSYFAEKLTEASTATLVEALKQVVNDFNTLLGELVGESFKTLSESMINLNTWQDNYKSYISDSESRLNQLLNEHQNISNRLEKLTNNFGEIDQSLHTTAKSIEKITLNAKSLELTAEDIARNNAIFETSLEQIKNLGVDARTVIPEIITSMDTIGTSLKNAVNNVSTNLDESSRKFIDINTTNLNNYVDRINKISEAMQSTTKALEEHLHTQLNQSLDSLASSLGALSHKFVSDYAPLTDKLRRIIEISEKVNEN